MITYYFGSKKTLYMYQPSARCQGAAWLRRDGFFRKVQGPITNLQLEAIRKHPRLLGFANSAYYETDPEVVDEIREAFADDDTLFNQLLLDGIELSGFKPGFDPGLVCNFMLWAGESFAAELFEKTDSQELKFSCLSSLRLWDESGNKACCLSLRQHAATSI